MMQKLAIRYKMTLFYGTLTCLLFIVFLPSLYFFMQRTLINNQESILQLSLSQLAAQVESHDGVIVLEDEGIGFPQTVAFILWNEDGSPVVQHGLPAWAETLPFEPGTIRKAGAKEDQWLLLDGTFQEDGKDISLRIAASLAPIQNTMNVVLTISLIAAPLLLAISIIGGLSIARRSLRPIDHIIETTEVIARGDLSERIRGVETRDEVGKLAEMINEMLDKVEAAFIREKRFTSDASHELRTPVSVIMAYTEALMEDLKQAQEEVKSLQVILSESRRMERIIGQLLMITRGQENQYPVQMEPLNISEMLEAVTEQMAGSTQAHGISLMLDAKAEICVKGDQSLLTQMMINLIENAVKYNRKDGHVWIQIRKTNDRCVITVTDDGIGIPAENLPHLFERFYRIDPSRDRTGSGLGLSIVQWIVKLHQGTVMITSEVGKGTTVAVTI